MKLRNTFLAFAALALFAAPVVASAHPAPSARTHTMTAHEHTQTVHIRTIGTRRER